MMNQFELPIKQLSFNQKLDLMETLWADMIGNEKNLQSPPWHGELLNERQTALDAGEISVGNWHAAKERIKQAVG
jgi:hypothetical protein